jgi:outer membrane protein TolC
MMVRPRVQPRIVLLVFVCLRAAAALSQAPEVAAAPASVRLQPLVLRTMKGEPQLPIDYVTALRLATAQNLDIMQARARFEEARGEHLRAIGVLFPSLSAGLTVSHIDGEIQASFGDLGRREFSTINPAGRISLQLNPGQAVFDVLAASKRADAGLSASESVTQETLARVAITYFALQRAQAHLDIAASALATAAELRQLARTREALGSGLEVDVARAEARYAREDVALTSAEELFRSASITLADALQLDPTAVLVPLEVDVQPLVLTGADRPLPELIEQALARRPEVHDTDLRIDAAGNTRSAALAKAVGPTVYGAFEESGIGRNFDVGNRQIYGGFVGWTFAPSSVGDVQVAGARLEQAHLQRMQVEQAVKADVVQTRTLMLTANARVSAARCGVVAAEESRSLSQDRFKHGAGLELEVIEAQESLTAARTALVDAIVAYNAAQVRLLRAIGDLSLTVLTASP